MVVLLSKDLMVSSQVSGAARSAGVDCRTLMGTDELASALSAGQNDLIIVDLATTGNELGQVLKCRDNFPEAKPRVVAFVQHVQEQKISDARAAGCDIVLTRGQFFSQLDELIRDDNE